MSHPANDDFSQHLSDDEASINEDASDSGTATNKPKQQQQQLNTTTTAISNIKLPILKKEEYDIWSMEMEHYLEYIDNDVWKVIQNGNSKKRISTGKDGVVRILPPVSAAEIHAVEKERKARNILLMAIPKDHLRRFHGMDDAKEIWEAIRTRFGGNANSKKMQKAVYKQQFEAFSISSSEGLEKGYDRFQQLLSQLEAHGAEVSTEDANHKFLRSLPPAWSNLAMTMRTKPDVDILSIDDLYNNLRVFEPEIKKDLDLLHEDLEQIDDVDIEEMDINWQIAMIAIIMKKFYKKTGRRVRIDGKAPVGFDKKKIECYKYYNTGHFARECTSNRTNDGKKKKDSVYQDQEARKQEKNQIGLLTMDDGVVNWGDHTADEETNHALMAISSNFKVSLCSKTCIDSYNKLKVLCDEQMNQLGEQEAKILAYTLAVKKLESQVATFQKQQLSLNEQLTFKANEIYEKDEKLRKYRRIGMKVVKEKDQLKKTVDSWNNSSKNLCKLIDSGTTSNSKIGLGYEIQSNNEVLSYEEEMNRSVFKCTEEDYVNKPLYSRFTKTNNFTGVPHPLSGDYTPKPQEEIDESLYIYGKKGPQEPEPSVSDDRSSECSTCKSNDSAGSIGTSSEQSIDFDSEISRVPQEVYVSKPVTINEKGVTAPKSKMKNWNVMMERELGEGYSFTKKKCFVYGSLSHLIKDCDFYEKKMAREAELKKQRVVNTGGTQVNSTRSNINTVRPNVNTGRPIVNSVRFNVNTVRPKVNSVRPKVNTGRTKQPVPAINSKDFSQVRPQGNWGTVVKTSAGYNWRNSRPNSNCDSGPTFIRTDHPLKNIEDRGIFDSGCSGHMTGNKDHLEDFEEFKGGSVTFGGSKGYITGKGRIKVRNLEFDSVSFVKELGHFNLFYISQICDKQLKVLFTETECLVVYPDFKMPDENQCMRTRSQARNRNRRQQQLTTVIVEEPEFPMADNRTMAQMLQAPIEGYEDAIVVPPINANNFELKQPLINLVQSNKFTGRQDPHNHLRFFNKVTSTFRHPEVPNTSIKLLLFPFSLDGEARDWLDKEPPRSILTWDDLVLKFINQFFPPSKTTYLRNEITTFYQKPNETFNEAWERFKGLLRQCPHHGFSELHQLDTFYNSLNTNDQDALDSAAGGNFLDKMPREGLAIIESKSKVRYSRSRPNDSRAITNAPSSTSSPSNNSFEIQQMAALLEDKMNIRMSRLEKAIS
ncbi:reverse transcriptase domain-containing protein [Tanacetum coccineum]